MRNKYGIGFFVIIFVMMAVVSFAYQSSYKKAREKAEARIEAAEAVRAQREQEAVSAGGHAVKEECYYLKEVNGYVVVFLSDNKTAYEYTDILCEELPETVRKELKNGKYMESLESLYGFLENYSS